MKIVVPNCHSNSQPGNSIGLPQHESTRLSDIFFSELTNVSESSVRDTSSMSDFFELQKEHLKVNTSDKMNLTVQSSDSSQRHSLNLFTSMTSNVTANVLSTSEITSADKSKAFDHSATPPSESVLNAGVGQKSSEQGEGSIHFAEPQQNSNNVFLNTTVETTTKSTSGLVASECFADQSSASIIKSPIRKKSKKTYQNSKGKSKRGLKLSLPDDKAADRTLKNPMKNISQGNPIISSVTKNQKGSYNLFLYSENNLRKLTIAPRGICKAGFIRWHCADRQCLAKVKTEIDKCYIEQYRKVDKNGVVSKRFDSRLKEGKVLQKSDLTVFEATLHTCIAVDTKREVKEKICEKAKNLCELIEPDTIRRPTRSEIVSKAVAYVLDEYRKNKIAIDPVALKKTCIPRAISRKLLCVLPLLPEVSLENRDNYGFAPEFSTGHYPIDLDYANETKNKTIIFFNSEILKKLSTGQSSVLADSTFPLKRNSIYAQLWILLKTDSTSTEIFCAVWMSDQKKKHI